MTPEQLRRRYCIPCGRRGNHTSLDNAPCPSKRRLVHEKINIARAAQASHDQENKRELKLIQSVFDYTNPAQYPSLPGNLQQIKSNTLLSLLLIEEAITPGIFYTKLKQTFEHNGLLPVEYNLETGTVAE